MKTEIFVVVALFVSGAILGGSVHKFFSDLERNRRTVAEIWQGTVGYPCFANSTCHWPYECQNYREKPGQVCVDPRGK